MIKVGHDLDDMEIERRYTAAATSLSMPCYFYPFVAQFASNIQALRILDVGCGNGQLLAELICRYPNSFFYGTELSSGRIKLAQQYLGCDVSFVQTGSSGYIPFQDNVFDLIFVTEVIEHLKQPVLFLREIYRLLASSGRLVLTTPNSDAYPLWKTVAKVAEKYPKVPLIKHFLPFEHPLKTLQPIDTVFSFDEVFGILHQAGFTPVHVIGREIMPFVFSLPVIRKTNTLAIRQELDGFFNKVKKANWCYRIFWECKKDE